MQWMLRNDEPACSITCHWVDGDWDTGAVLAQQSIPITDDDDRTSLFGNVVEKTGDVRG